MSCRWLTDLVSARRYEVVAIVVLVNFAVAFAVAVALEVDLTIRTGTFLVAFAAIGLFEYAVIVRRYAFAEQLLAD